MRISLHLYHSLARSTFAYPPVESYLTSGLQHCLTGPIFRSRLPLRLNDRIDIRPYPCVEEWQRQGLRQTVSRLSPSSCGCQILLTLHQTGSLLPHNPSPEMQQRRPPRHLRHPFCNSSQRRILINSENGPQCDAFDVAL